jgi:predicted transcriptional regulator
MTYQRRTKIFVGTYDQEIELDDETCLLLMFSQGAKMRKNIIEKLLYGPKNCNQIAKELESDWWTIQKHLQRLEKAGLIKSISLGRLRFYKITFKGEKALKLIQGFPK